MQTIIFDLDGVLADSESLWSDIDAAFLSNFDIPYYGEHKLSVMGKSFAMSAQFYKDQYKLSPSVMELTQMRTDAAQKFYATKINLFPSVPEVLAQLQEMKLQIGLATSSMRQCALPLLERHGIKKYFSAITTGDELERSKPDPDIYLRAAKKLRVDPKTAIAVEDSPAGIKSAHDAGMQVIAIPDHELGGVEEWTKNATMILDNVDKVPAAVTKILRK